MGYGNKIEKIMMEDRGIVYRLLKEKFGDGIREPDMSSDIPSYTIDSASVLDIVSFLKDDPELNFGFLTDICGIHYPDNELPLGVIYHLHNLERNERLRIKTFVKSESPDVPSLTPVFSSANWMERETWDFYGINFTGHPNLIRILNVEYLDFFPMRKEYPVEDPTREDKDDRFFGR
jgi:NADH-quinone oxidoreductase subunit C